MAASAPHSSDGSIVYNGHCRNLTENERMALSVAKIPSIRIAVPNIVSSFVDGHYGEQKCNLQHDCGDFIVQRADGNFAYQLAVVTDDALMGITEVVRGRDLLQATHQQLFLYKQLNYNIPTFTPLPLLITTQGARLAKRDKAADMGILRQQFKPEELLGTIAFLSHLIDRQQPISLAELTKEFSWSKIPKEDICCDL